MRRKSLIIASLAFAAILLGRNITVSAAEKFTLAGGQAKLAVQQVEVDVEVGGDLKMATDAKVKPTKMSVVATLKYQERVVAGVSARRLMFEALVVAAAIGGALLLRDRGVAAVSEATDGSGVDPLIAAVPALVGIAAGILVVRLYPIPLAGVAWLAARGRGLVPMLAAGEVMPIFERYFRDQIKSSPRPLMRRSTSE